MPRLSKEKWAEIISRYQDGELAISLAKEFGCSSTAVSTMLKRKGITIHSSSYVYRKSAGHSVNEMAFDVITPESAYWIGFLMADGCITKGNTISLVLAEKDESHLEKLKKFLSASNKITTGIKNRYSTNCKEVKASRFAVRSKLLCEALNKYGVTPKKSATAIASKQIALNNDFWRGVVDGDGYISLVNKKSYFNTNPRVNAWSKPRTTARLELVGSKPLLEQFKNFVETIVTNANISVRNHKSIFRVGISDKTAELVIYALYENAEIALQRKINAAKNIRSFATGGEPGIARGAWNLLATASTREEARTEEIHDADRMERAAA